MKLLERNTQILQKEIPYSVEIEVEEFFDEEDIIKIRAIIFVARESQKGFLGNTRVEESRHIGREIWKLFSRKRYFWTCMSRSIKIGVMTINS